MKTCTVMRKEKELNKNIGSKSLHYFVQRSLVSLSDKSCKATGPDEVPAELIKAGGETVLDRMHRICVATWKTGEWPEERKGDLKQCANYRTIDGRPCKQDPSLDHTGKDLSED